jgi:hypothetical protein
MYRFEDLRFSIGTFFLIVGILLLAAGALQTENADAANLNFVTGGGLIIFAVGALAVSIMRPLKKS